MTTTRPTVHFKEPDQASFGEFLGAPVPELGTYSTIEQQENQPQPQEYSAVALVAVGILLAMTAVVLMARKYYFKIT